MTDPAPITLEQLFRFGRGLPHQLAAVSELEQEIRANGYDAAMRRDRPWFKTWSQSTQFKPSSPFDFLITPHICYGEFSLYQEVRRFDHQHQCDTALKLAQFLERVRMTFGNNSIVITSGFRPPIINKQIGGASSSEHLYDAPGVGAVDFYVEKTDIYEVQRFCDKIWPYSVGFGAPKGFVHLGIRKGQPRLRWDY
jgi:hypothetical protein